ncbi:MULTISPECIES: amidohydrolase [Rhizobium/Agrobacterium group]|uniref:Omega-amidase YafV n=1 Tax=Rhizobium rhizogenes TaxID=359 RepID=A0A546XQ65_RHIRH|nr:MULTISPECIES: amidohydrolase [Rhizobium/Agrobacterium group]TRB02891.1 amidohydrolase [Rhizobium rhizogenes]
MSDRDLRITLVQADLAWENAGQNLLQFDRHLDEIGATDLIVLPEMFTTGFSMNPQAVAEPMDGPAVEWLRETARQHDADIVGSVAIREDGRYFNRLLWARPDGTLIHYDKRHLFTYAGEHEHYTPGQVQQVVHLKGWNIAPFICFDLRFPVWSRNRGQYDAALYIASWPARRAAHWKSLLPARAIENQAYVIGVNRVGIDGNDLAYEGDSMVIDPLGDICFHANVNAVVHQQQLSRRMLDDTRAKLPFLRECEQFELTV